MKAFLDRVWNGRWGEYVRYIVAGGLTTLVSLGVFQGLCALFGVDPEAPDSVYVTVSNAISVVTAVIFAYVVNKRMVFRSRCETAMQLLREFFSFVGGRVFTMLLELAGVYLLVNVLGQYPLLGKIETEVVVVITNYIISKFIVFRKRKQNKTHIAK